jgi:hypothetical protein
MIGSFSSMEVSRSTVFFGGSQRGGLRQVRPLFPEHAVQPDQSRPKYGFLSGVLHCGYDKLDFYGVQAFRQ